MMGKKLLAMAIVAITINLALAVDQTRVDKANGFDVVDASCELIRNSQIFTDDSSFLLRVAFVETHFGIDDGTFTSNNFKGIWRLNEVSYNITKSSSLNAKHANITSVFNINWNNTNWDQLNTPLYGALAARLFIETLPGSIPQTKDKQAKYWYDYYTKLDKPEAYFKNETAKLEEDTPPCEGKMDLVVVLDGSGSVTAPEFTKAKSFVANLLDTFSYDISFVRKAFIVFSAVPETIFPLTNSLNATEMKRQVLNARYPAQGTITNEAIKSAVNLFQIAPNRTGVPRVMTLFTDGQSQGGVSNIEMARRESITPFAIGIGDPKALNPNELLEIALKDPSRVYTVENFDALTEFFRRLNDDTCKVPQQPGNETTSDTLGQKQKRFYRFSVPEEGITITLDNIKGNTGGFFSYHHNNPSSAINDGTLSSKTFVAYKNQTAQQVQYGLRASDGTVYVSVTGKDSTNEYTIQAAPGAGMITVPLAMLIVLSAMLNIFK